MGKHSKVLQIASKIIEGTVDAIEMGQ